MKKQLEQEHTLAAATCAGNFGHPSKLWHKLPPELGRTRSTTAAAAKKVAEEGPSRGHRQAVTMAAAFQLSHQQQVKDSARAKVSRILRLLEQVEDHFRYLEEEEEDESSDEDEDEEEPGEP